MMICSSEEAEIIRLYFVEKWKVGAVKASNLAGESLVSKGGNVPCCSEH